jgi:7,8-dihydropterin-6-yl-methyl-4-(beta-D-ribofuranosyl)aminobenzene 5'-phosphate synthase
MNEELDMVMKLTVLVDNNTLIDRYFLAEPGLSFFIEADGKRVLFDTGYSDVFLTNAHKLGLDLANLDYVALSHGHQDHTWGLEPLVRFYAELEIEKRLHFKPTVVAHPKTFTSVRDEGFAEAGSLLSENKLSKHFTLQLGTEPFWISSNLVYLGEIPRRNDFEGRLTFGRKEGEDAEDTVPEDSALAYVAPEGVVVITGCAHAGICNTIEYALEVCSDNRVLDVIGGFHLQNPSQKQLNDTLSYFEKLRPRCLHACHCTDLQSKIALARVANMKEVGVGLSLHA